MMNLPDTGPTDLIRVIKTLTREEVEAYAVLNALTVETLASRLTDSPYLDMIHIPHGSNPEEDKLTSKVLDLGSEVSKKIQEEVCKSSIRKN